MWKDSHIILNKIKSFTLFKAQLGVNDREYLDLTHLPKIIKFVYSNPT
jgi:hypothetical protein